MPLSVSLYRTVDLNELFLFRNVLIAKHASGVSCELSAMSSPGSTIRSDPSVTTRSCIGRPRAKKVHNGVSPHHVVRDYRRSMTSIGSSRAARKLISSRLSHHALQVAFAGFAVSAEQANFSRMQDTRGVIALL